MKRTLRLVPVAALALTVLAGCSHAFREPQVTLANLVTGGFGLKGGSVVAQLEVKNPNPFTLSTRSIDYQFEVLDATKSDTSWVSVTKGVIDKEIRVGGNDRTIVEIPIDFNYSDFGAVSRSIMDRGSFRYRVTGSVDLRDPIKRTIPFRKQDTFSLATIR
jgi:LEA14-like dessication related protein